MMETGKLFELRRRTFDTPHFRGIEFIETEAKSIINHVPGNYLPFEWTINPYRGCQHACVMCFARATHTYMDMNAGKDFETKIVVKVNAGELLRKELRAKRWKGDGIAMGTATDPYQRAEGKYKLMPQIIGALTDYRNPFSILTKGTLIVRDLELLQEAATVTDISTAFSIATLDEEVARKAEPGAPSPRKRMDAVRKLNEAGIPCGVLVAAVLPGINDSREQLKEVVEAALDAGATHVYPILLHLRPKVREVYMEWLQTEYPDLVGRYEQMYPKAYAPRADQKALSATVQEIIAEAPKPKRHPPVRTGARHRDASKARAEVSRLSAEQLELL
ncbi:MAG: radical SAM protein [Actinomycetota bacterium]|nr:radical SAM protein [Actinomycetota bacterium]